MSAPSISEVKRIRHKLNLTQSQMAQLLGITLRAYQKREEVMKTRKTEFEMLQLLAGEHELYVVCSKDPSKSPIEGWVMDDSTHEELRAIRESLGLTIAQMAELTGYARSGWNTKELPDQGTTVRPGEYNYLMLLANKHPNLYIYDRE
ncbi:hypothetical protein [Rouxiella silvae]